MNKDKLLKVCEQIAQDVENDAKEFDGKPFDGKTVAQYFGYHGAAIKALSDIIKELLPIAEKAEQLEKSVTELLEFKKLIMDERQQEADLWKKHFYPAKTAEESKRHFFDKYKMHPKK